VRLLLTDPMNDLTHFDDKGASRMVDVGAKGVTRRVARASGHVRMAVETLATIRARKVAGTLRVPSPAAHPGDLADAAPTRRPGAPVPAQRGR
jgi:hypothetical protein